MLREDREVGSGQRRGVDADQRGGQRPAAVVEMQVQEVPPGAFTDALGEVEQQAVRWLQPVEEAGGLLGGDVGDAAGGRGQ